MNYTSIDQSRKLSELGLSNDTADMCYWMQYHRAIDGGGQHLEDRPSIGNGNKESIPCWSVGALIKILPNDIVYTDKYTDPIHCMLNLTRSGVGYCSSFNEYTDRSFNRCWGENPDLIDALYNCVVWLLEEGHIKKEK